MSTISRLNLVVWGLLKSSLTDTQMIEQYGALIGTVSTYPVKQKRFPGGGEC